MLLTKEALMYPTAAAGLILAAVFGYGGWRMVSNYYDKFGFDRTREEAKRAHERQLEILRLQDELANNAHERELAKIRLQQEESPAL